MHYCFNAANTILRVPIFNQPPLLLTFLVDSTVHVALVYSLTLDLETCSPP